MSMFVVVAASAAASVGEQADDATVSHQHKPIGNRRERGRGSVGPNLQEMYGARGQCFSRVSLAWDAALAIQPKPQFQPPPPKPAKQQRAC